MIADERFADGLDDRDAAGDRRFEVKRDVVGFGQRDQFVPVLGEQRLVARDHDFLRFERRLDQVMSFLDPSHQFDHDLNAGVGHQFAPVAGQFGRRALQRHAAARFAHGDAADLEPVAGSLGQQVAVALEVLVDPRTHVPQPSQPNG